MPIFRDLDGNFYDIPKEQLRKYRVEGDLPDSAKQVGAEVDVQAPSRQVPGPAYFWDAPQAPAYFWDPRATPRPSAYFWDPRVQQQGPRPAAYFYDHPGQPQYFWDRPAPVRPEPVEAPAAPAAEPRAAAYAYAEAGTPSEPAPIKTKKTRSSKKSSRAG
jgi:hypothetical protein